MSGLGCRLARVGSLVGWAPTAGLCWGWVLSQPTSGAFYLSTFGGSVWWGALTYLGGLGLPWGEEM